MNAYWCRKEKFYNLPKLLPPGNPSTPRRVPKNSHNDMTSRMNALRKGSHLGSPLDNLESAHDQEKGGRKDPDNVALEQNLAHDYLVHVVDLANLS